MDWHTERSGRTIVFDHNPYEPGGVEEIVVEATVTAFASARSCGCGERLDAHYATDGRLELRCPTCCSVTAHFDLGTRAHR